MNILVIGLNHKSASVDLREKFALAEEALPGALAAFRKTRGVLEGVILSTCNRTELYAVVDQLHRGTQFSKNFLQEWFDIPKSAFQDHLYIKEDREAVRHLFRVVSGLDSMVLGETQILGQVKDAFLTAQQAGNTGSLFNRLFKQAISFGKRAQSETLIGQQAVSTSYAALELMKKVYGNLQGMRVAVVGAGEMGRLTVEHLHAAGVRKITVFNRDRAKALQLAGRFGAAGAGLDELATYIARVDVLISSTASAGYILRREDLERVLPQRKGKPLFLLDMAVPRDLDPDIHALENAYLYNIDDLQNLVRVNLETRKKEAQKIERWIEEEIGSFEKWVQQLGVTPLIAALREKTLRIQQETMRSLENKLPDLSERELKMLRKHTLSIVNQMMRDPIERLKEIATEPGAKEAQNMFTYLFALEEILLVQELREEDESQEASEGVEQRDMKYEGEPERAYIPATLFLRT